MIAPEIKEITAYQCTCGNAYLTKGSALSCCVEQPEKLCNCGAKISKNKWRCAECRDRANQLEWECAERSPQPQDAILWSKWSDKYISYDTQEFLESLDLEEEEYRELLKLPLDELARKFQIYICKPQIPIPLNLNDQYQDFCYEDEELPGDWEAAEQAIEDWIKSVSIFSWPQHPTKIAWNGVGLPKEEVAP